MQEKQVSVIIPVLNMAVFLPRCLAALRHAAVREVIVVDGGSTDSSAATAAALGAVVLATPPGRGGQMQAGAVVAQADWLLFLHADTVLPPDWPTALANADAARAYYFRFQLDSPKRAARRLEWIAQQRCRWLALPYGDQGLLIHSDLLKAAGGMPDLPLMEDVVLARRLGGKRLRQLPCAAISSAARYERGGFIRRPLRNFCCLTLFFAGVPVRLIQKLYG